MTTSAMSSVRTSPAHSRTAAARDARGERQRRPAGEDSGRSYVQSPLLAVVRPTCCIDGCDRPRGTEIALCYGHRTRLDRHGDLRADVPLARRVRHRPGVRHSDDFVDEVAVERAVKGDRSLQLSRPEMAQAVALLTDAGMTARQIADVLGVTWRTVVRWRARIRSAS